MKKSKSNFNVLLIAPTFKEKWNKLDLSCKENLAISYLGAYLETCGYNVYIVNAFLENWDNYDVLDRFSNTDFDFIGVSCSSQKVYPISREFIVMAREKYPRAFITIGGVFPTMCYKQILEDLPSINAVSLGEGEYSLSKICDCLLDDNIEEIYNIEGIALLDKNREIICNSPKRIVDLDKLPFPKRDKRAFTDTNGKMAYMIAGKGCYGNCTYCSIKGCFHYSKRICRSPKNIVDEIEGLIKLYGITYIQFHDDIFYDYSKNSQEWLYSFVEEIKQRNLNFTFRIYLRPNDVKSKEIKMLKEIGLKTVFIGAESGVQRILDEMNKHVTPDIIRESIRILRENDVEVHLGFITLVPTATFEELEENYNFLYSLGDDVINDANLHNRLNIYNGCEYENILEKYDLLLPKENFWDIHSYKFLDEKVQLYHDVLQQIKEYARKTKQLENVLLKQFKEEEEICEFIRKININMWITMTKLLLKEIKKCNGKKIKVEIFQNIIDNVLCMYNNISNKAKI